MHRYKIIVTFFILTGLFQQLTAQIESPQLYCVKGDTLHWNAPATLCGPFTSYNIYFATSVNGPFTLLTSINTFNTLSYVFQNSPGGTLYYYMTTSANCPGLSEWSSDTLDNASPLPAEIDQVTVLGQDVLLEWSPSISPEVYAYIIYKALPGGNVVALDTVTGFTFTDAGKYTSDSVYSYHITAIDRCGGTSIFSEKHSTLLLQGQVDTCKNTFRVDFNPYEGWSGSISYDILLSKNGAAEYVAGTTGQTTFNLDSLDDGTIYCVRIRARETVTGRESYANVYCASTGFNPPVSYLCIDEVNAEKSIIRFRHDPGADIRQMFLGGASDAGSLNNAVFQSITYQSYETGLADPSTYQQLRATDGCDNTLNSLYFIPVILDAHLSPDNSVRLTWNEPDWEERTGYTYRLERLRAGNAPEVIFSGIATNFTDHPVQAGIVDSQYCYRLIATIDLLCDNQPHQALAISKNVCVQKSAGFYAPNALKAGGVNPEFKPVLIFPESIATYELNIYDRYGGRLFHSTDPDYGWTGDNGTYQAPPGVYTWQIMIKSQNGENRFGTGTLVLIR